MTDWILPVLLAGIMLYALGKRVNAYSTFVKGASEGLSLFLSVYPSLLAMMCAISLLRTSGLMDALIACFSHIPFVPSAMWPMILFRPISGSASLAVLVDLFQNQGVDSYVGIMGSILQGSTDTTLYVISLYFSHVQVHKIKNALTIGLIADIAGMGMAIFLAWLCFA